MKILRDTDWSPCGWVESIGDDISPRYLFQHKKFGDIVALKAAKYIDVAADIVYFYDARRHEISVSYACQNQMATQGTPILRTQA